MNEQAMRFRVGVFAFTMIVLLGVLILLFGSLTERFRPHIPYTVVLRDATGIGAGTPVRRSGVRIGVVRDVRLDNDTGLVHVEIAVERNYPLHENDEARVVRGLLGGDVAIDFSLPTSDQETTEEAEEQQPPPAGAPARPGTVFRAADQPAADRFFGQAATLVPDAREALQEFRQTLRRVDRFLPRVEASFQEVRELAKDARAALPEARNTARQWSQAGERLNTILQSNQDKAGKALDNLVDATSRAARLMSDENQQNLAEALKNFRAGTANFEGMAKNADVSINQSRQAFEKLNVAARLAEETFTNLNRAAKPWGDRSDAITKNLEEGSAAINVMFRDFRELFRAVGGGEGTVKALLTDPSLYNNLNDAACMIVRILPRVDRALKDLELFADKIARHPESIGLGGVVHPGSGLKR